MSDIVVGSFVRSKWKSPWCGVVSHKANSRIYSDTVFEVHAILDKNGNPTQGSGTNDTHILDAVWLELYVPLEKDMNIFKDAAHKYCRQVPYTGREIDNRRTEEMAAKEMTRSDLLRTMKTEFNVK